MSSNATPGQAQTVSIIIPAYNQAGYVLQAVQSVLDQTHPDFELVIVDDGSTDETPQLLTNILDQRVRIVRQANGGLSAARNTGIHESSAPLVAFLDADDYFMPDMLEVLVAYLGNHPDIGLVSGETIIVSEDGQPISKSRNKPAGMQIQNLLVGNPFSACSVMLRRVWLDRVGCFDESLRACEDWELWQRLAYAGCKLAWVEHMVVAYRYHGGQMTREPERMRKAIFQTLDKFFSQPGIPESIAAYKNQAYANGYINAAAFAYHANIPEQGQQDLADALRVYPRLCEDCYKQLVSKLVGWSNNPRTRKPADFLARIIAHPPPNAPRLKRQLYRALSDVLMAPFFVNAKPFWRQNRRDLLLAIRYKPGWLFNRGVLRILFDAFLSPAPSNSN